MDRDILAPLGCYAANVGSCLQTFQESLSVPSSTVKHSIRPIFKFEAIRQSHRLDSTSPWAAGIFKRKPIDCPETSAKHYQYMLSNNPEVLGNNLDREGSFKSHNMGLNESMWTEFMGLMEGTIVNRVTEIRFQ